MTAINFGVGTLIARRTGVANPTPAFMGIMQDVDVSFDQSLKELMGQYKLAVDVAPAQLKITGKAKFARIQSLIVNDLLLGNSVTSAAGLTMAVGEANTVPGSVAYTITVSHSATFKADLGVFYAATGIQLVRVASGSEATGKYSVNETTGVYTFDLGDANAAVTIYYDYGVTTLTQINGTNQFMGTGPVFEAHLQSQYTNNLGVTNTLHLKLNACRASKLNMPMKNVDYTIQELDFQAFADASGAWGTLSVTE